MFAPGLLSTKVPSQSETIRPECMHVSAIVMRVVSYPTKMLARPLNEMLISCKRPVRTYGPLLPLGGSDAGGAPAGPRLSAALAG
jgi:hypothetical protein